MVASCDRNSTAMTMGAHSELNSSSIRKMLRPVHTAPDSPVTSPENTRGHSKVSAYYNILLKQSKIVLPTNNRRGSDIRNTIILHLSII